MEKQLPIYFTGLLKQICFFLFRLRVKGNLTRNRRPTSGFLSTSAPPSCHQPAPFCLLSTSRACTKVSFYFCEKRKFFDISLSRKVLFRKFSFSRKNIFTSFFRENVKRKVFMQTRSSHTWTGSRPRTIPCCRTGPPFCLFSDQLRISHIYSRQFSVEANRNVHYILYFVYFLYTLKNRQFSVQKVDL